MSKILSNYINPEVPGAFSGLSGFKKNNNFPSYRIRILINLKIKTLKLHKIRILIPDKIRILTRLSSQNQEFHSS